MNIWENVDTKVGRSIALTSSRLIFFPSTTATSGEAGRPMWKNKRFRMMAVSEPIVTPEPKMICSQEA